MRINFKSGVPEILYRKAGGRCSVPRCKNPTMGPFYEKDGAVNMGVACHIHSAAANGPRGYGGKDANFLSSEENGIWCCQYHASLVDKANGNDYPATVLFAWKALAEARVLKQMNDRPSPLGWIESIEFLEFPRPGMLPKISLSRYTLLGGKNGSGKTSLMEAVASVSQARYATRFSSARKRDSKGENESLVTHAKVIYSTVDSLSKELDLRIAGMEITRIEGGLSCLLPPGDLEVIYCSSSDARRLESEDDIDFMMRVLNVDWSALFALAKIGVSVIMPGEIDFRPSRVYSDEDDSSQPKFKENGKPFYEMLFKKRSGDFFVSFSGLSGSEQDRLILDFLILKTREVSKQRLTLLVVEDFALSLDAANFEKLLRCLAAEDFQVLVILPPAREKDILDVNNGERALQSLEYLVPWRLAFLPGGSI